MIPLLALLAAQDVESIVPMGPLILRSSVPGDRREDNVSPNAAGACRLSQDRWILVYYTRGYRVVDEQRSVLYQIREGTPDGKVLKEGLLDSWNAYGDPLRVKAHGHATVWGVPKGATRDGAALPHANLFCAKWYASELHVTPGNPRGTWKSKWVEWVQFRLNARGDDIDLLQPVARIDRGHTPLSEPVALDASGREWADLCQAEEGGFRAVRYRFDPATGLYAAVQHGPVAAADVAATEGSLAFTGSEWLLAGRVQTGGAALMRSKDPFAAVPAPKVVAPEIGNLQKVIYRCADGKVRLFSGQGSREVAYAWDVDADALSNRRVIWDSRTLEAPFDGARGRAVLSYRLFPHAGGREQIVAYGFRPKALDVPYASGLAGEAEKDAAGVYYSKIVYTRPIPAPWTFSRQ